jgi:hypothetical protein
MFKYHVDCLQKWFDIHFNRGVLKNISVKTYSIYVDGERIVTVPLRQRVNPTMSISIENKNIENNNDGCIFNNDAQRCYYIVSVVIMIVVLIFMGRRYIV